jgi:hypothetical protein
MRGTKETTVIITPCTLSWSVSFCLSSFLSKTLSITVIHVYIHTQVKLKSVHDVKSLAWIIREKLQVNKVH